MVDKLSIKEEMRAIDTKDRLWYDSLSDEEKSKVGIWLLMRYTSNATDKQLSEHYLEMTNEAVNVHFNTLRKHPQLQHKLLQVVGVGVNTYHPWLAPGKAQKKNKLQSWIAQNYPELNDDEVELYSTVNTKEDFKNLFEQHGMTDKEIKELLK